jgi:Fur family ferric uptake transcriptional regulator
MSTESPDSLLRQAEERGIKLATSRRRIIQIISSLGTAFTTGKLLAAVARQEPTIGRATVFRTLQLLHDLHLLERIRLDNGRVLYVTGHPHRHHHHLICNGCGEVRSLFGCGLEALVAAWSAQQGFRAQGHTFDIYGLCAACQRDEK